MEFLLDTANLEAIRRYNEIFPVTGVTSNPSILKAEGKVDFFVISGRSVKSSAMTGRCISRYLRATAPESSRKRTPS